MEELETDPRSCGSVGNRTNAPAMEHCGEIGWNNDYFTNDNACILAKFGICEKRLQYFIKNNVQKINAKNTKFV